MGTKSVESELNREMVYNYIKDNPKVTAKQIAKHFGFTKSKTDYYIRPMVIKGVLNKTYQTTYAEGRQSQFTIGKKSFSRALKTDEEIVDEKLAAEHAKLPVELQSVARIVKLSNRNMQPMYRRGQKRKSGSSWVGSSMGLFDGY